MARLSSVTVSSTLLMICIGLLALREPILRDEGQTAFLKQQLKLKERELAEAKFHERLLVEDRLDSQNIIAQNIPSLLKGVPENSKSYELRTIASVVSPSSKDLKIERASSLLESAKHEFRAKDYKNSNAKLEVLVRNYPNSLHGPEARFLLVEGYFQTLDYEACLNTVEQMIRLYPESELTGFSLLRMAKIYEKKDRLEDAADIYRSINDNFSQPELKRQAKLSLKAIDL